MGIIFLKYVEYQGIPPEEISKVVESTIKQMDLEQFAGL
jgi:hypothetical protein